MRGTALQYNLAKNPELYAEYLVEETERLSLSSIWIPSIRHWNMNMYQQD